MSTRLELAGKLSSHVALDLYLCIRNGKFLVGSRLASENSLMLKYNVGRNTAREAISILRSAGVVESRRGSGTRVIAQIGILQGTEFDFPLTGKNQMLLDLYDYRRGLEIEIVAKSAFRRTENDLNKLRQNLGDLECRVMNGKETAECSASFHQLLVESAHSDIAIGMFLNIKLLLFQLMSKLEKMKGAPEETLIAHRNILSAVEAGDIELAKKEMFKDMENARDNLIWSLSNDPSMANIRI